MINTDYKIEALGFLLDKSCLSERYWALIEYKDRLISGLCRLRCERKSDADKLTDDAYDAIGLSETALIRLFRRFLTIYDPSPTKFRELSKLVLSESEREAYTELYHLPGVKQTRAELYYRSGYETLEDIASATADEILEKTARTIEENGLSCIVPLPKEVRTHIAVAKAFTAE